MREIVCKCPLVKKLGEVCTICDGLGKQLVFALVWPNAFQTLEHCISAMNAEEM